jgi:hypothetical protein
MASCTLFRIIGIRVLLRFPDHGSSRSIKCRTFDIDPMKTRVKRPALNGSRRPVIRKTKQNAYADDPEKRARRHRVSLRPSERSALERRVEQLQA